MSISALTTFIQTSRQSMRSFVSKLVFKLTVILLFFITIPVANAESVVALLPMTGSQSAAGKEIAKAIQNQLGIKHKLVFVDRSKYDSFASAWQAVMKKNPDLVIGPVAMEDVADLILSEPTVPTIALNRVAESYPKVWQIGLSLEYTAIQLAELLHDQGQEKILLLMHDTPTAERSWKAFLEAWQGEMVDVASFATVHDIKLANRRLLHSNSGIQRITALRNVLGQKAESMPWVRHDADVLLMVSPLHEALELSFRTDHLWDQGMNVYWLDSGSQPINEFVSTSVNWGKMNTLMSPYLMQMMQKNKDVQPEQNFFRALGHDSALLANIVFDHQESRLQLNETRITESDTSAEKGYQVEDSSGDQLDDDKDDKKYVLGWLGKLSLEEGGKIGIELLQVRLGGGNVDEVD